MGQALYRQYRPKSLAEVVGQEHITETLLHALKQGKLAHAYLFTGPRGVGKTSIARIMAHEINGLPYEDDSMHLDIIEIDAASNRRIDEIRDLRDKVNIAPTSAKYKVYIIDEVHMLTREAFNALLKTLEEPPAHAVFILATTESHKLPETIVSRTQRFIFKPVAQEKVIGHLRTIAEAEGLEISDDALALVAGYGGGSFRDSISLLDQTRGQSGKVESDFVRLLIGVPTNEAIASLQGAIKQHDAAGLVRTLVSLQEQGFGAAQIAKQLGKTLRQDVIAKQADSSVFELLQKLLNVPSAHDPESFLQLILLEHALQGELSAPPAAPTSTPRPTVQNPAAAAVTKPTPVAARSDAPKLTMQTPKPVAPAAATPQPQTPEPALEQPPAQLGKLIEVDDQLWPSVLGKLKKTHNTLYGIARMARTNFYEDGLELGFSFAFHKRRFSETKNKDIIAGYIKELTGKDIPIHVVGIDKDAAPPPTRAIVQPGAVDSKDLAAISDVFGSAEVVEE